MLKVEEFAFSFVDYVPENPDEGQLYISTEFATAVHLCACGCRKEVVTPLSPAGWSLTYDGDSVSLRPSIGNWGFDCRSHYWIKSNDVVWSSPWSRDEINAGREADREASQTYFGDRTQDADLVSPMPQGDDGRGFWTWIKSWFR